MALMLADKNRALFRLDAEPADIFKPTVAELKASIQCADRTFLSGSYLRATNSETFKEAFMNGDPNAGFGESNYEGSLSVARFYGADGKPDATADALFDAVRVKGTVSVWAERRGCAWDAEIAADQEFSIFVAMNDNPQTPQEASGYDKVTSTLAIQKAALFVKAVA